MTKLAPEWVRTSDPVIRSPARYRWTMAPAYSKLGEITILILKKLMQIGVMTNINYCCLFRQ